MRHDVAVEDVIPERVLERPPRGSEAFSEKNEEK
jgi:hypothetical protein